MNMNRGTNAIPLQQAVLCADCEMISGSRHEVCVACGGTALVNLARLLGGTLDQERAVMVDTSALSIERVLASLEHGLAPGH
jgi:hypothetical protein